jgi:hypothetical protein
MTTFTCPGTLEVDEAIQPMDFRSVRSYKESMLLEIEERLGCGVIGSTTDSDSVSWGSSPYTPMESQ